jgi:hypothetical protein
MSGRRDRVKEFGIRDVVVRGVTGEINGRVVVGRNDDEKEEIFVESLPNDLVLLCANQYAADGAVILFGTDGLVVKMGDDEVEGLREVLLKHGVDKYLVVKNGTYHVEPSEGSEGVAEKVEVFSANTSFNTKVNVSNGEERILAYLLSGLTWDMLWDAVHGGSLLGLHPGITKTLLSRFARKWGKTPDVAQLAHPNVTGNEKGYMSEREREDEVGVVQMDIMFYDFNESISEVPLARGPKWPVKRRSKLMTFGGAIAASLLVDEKTGYCLGKLVRKTAVPLEVIEEAFGIYKMYGHKIRKFKADSGISTSSEFKVFTTEVDKFLIKEGCEIVKAEPFNHANGIPLVERCIQSVKNKMRMAFQYALTNQNIVRIGFSPLQITRLWGEIFYWAVGLEKMRRAPGVEMTRHQAFTGRVPHIQEFRLLPIFAVIKVHRQQQAGSRRVGDPNQSHYEYGLYVGGCPHGKGLIRAAVLTNRRVHIVRTSKYKGVSDGGDAVQYQHVENGIHRMVEDGVPFQEGLDQVHEEVGVELGGVVMEGQAGIRGIPGGSGDVTMVADRANQGNRGDENQDISGSLGDSGGVVRKGPAVKVGGAGNDEGEVNAQHRYGTRSRGLVNLILLNGRSTKTGIVL